MKKSLFFVATIILLSSFTVPLRKVEIKSTHPYFEYSFAAVSADGTPDINLEKSSAVYQLVKGKTATPVLTIAGAKSTIRLKVGAGEFRAHPVPGMPSISANNISLYKLSTDKKNRSLSVDVTADVISATKVNIYLTQIDAQTYRIAITGGISLQGEYAFVENNGAAANSTLTVWCFGVD
jgi:hypothetical protein